MARLIPKVSLDEIFLKPERDVAAALISQLPDDCIVYHSYPWLRSDRNERTRSVTLREGETDFVIVSPKLGFLVLEVKGGEIHYDEVDGLWYRRLASGRKKEIQDPFAQVRRNTHFLEKKIREESFPSLEAIPCPYGYAVVFPDCEYDGKAPPGADTKIILSAKDMGRIGERVMEILGCWRRSPLPVPLSKQELDGIVKALSPVFQLLPVLFRQIDEQETHLFRLTEEQGRLLDFLSSHDRAAIRGVAGSGKTLLAHAQAQRFADRELRTLFVCYNKALAEWLRSSMPEPYQEKITVRHFHGLCSDWCRQASVDFSVPTNDQAAFWKYKAADLLSEAIDCTSERFDAVVVDEGQDFYPEWWIPLEFINRDGDQGPLYVFYDPAQNLFVDESLLIPELGRPFSLPTNCRNTKRIAAVCGEIRKISVAVRPDAPEGSQCEVRLADTVELQQRMCGEYVARWIGKGRLKAQQIAILSPYDRTRSSLSQLTTIGKTPLTDDPLVWKAGEAILFATIRSFKGLEADVVIMIDVASPDKGPAFTTADFYVGCSRAKHVLVILAREDNILPRL
jgi:hypothetical protein